jgi:rod shape-determining protein MreC
MRAERTSHARRYWAALLLLLAGSLAGTWHNRTAGSGRQDIISGTARTVVAPPAHALGGVSRWGSGQLGWLLNGRAVAAENRRLKARVEDLEGQNAQLLEAERRYEQLRDDLKFVRSLKQEPLAADVLARRPNPDFDTILISRGSRDGVHVNSVVRTRLGLVGKVSEVTPTTATVILLTDPNGGVGARVQRATSRSGIGVCKGDGNPLIPLIDLPNDADIKPGDIIVTSGFSTVLPSATKGAPGILQTYPKGLPIGTVVEVKNEEGSVGKIARLRPSVDFDRLEEVYVLP